KAAVPDLLLILRSSKSYSMRTTVALALGKIGPEAKEAVPTLIELMKPTLFSEKVSRVHVAVALGKIGPAAKDAVSALIKALNDPNKEVKREAAKALMK